MTAELAHIPAQASTIEAENILTVYAKAAELAHVISNASMMPDHLRGKPAEATLVFAQAIRWGMDPFAVAQCTSIQKGKLMYEGKLVHAALMAMKAITEPFRYDFSGSGGERSCTVTGKLPGGGERTITVILREVRTTGMTKDGKPFKNAWDHQPDTQLSYRGARDWARRYAPGIMLGIVTPEEELPMEERPVIRQTAGAVVDDKHWSQLCYAFGLGDEGSFKAWESCSVEGVPEGKVLADLRSGQLAELSENLPDSGPLNAWRAELVEERAINKGLLSWAAVVTFLSAIEGLPQEFRDCTGLQLKTVALELK